eukprot:524254-Pelagomonas_calceolata.AAC.8
MSSEPSKLGNTARLLFAACVGACLNEAIQLASHQPRLSLLWLTLLGAFAWRQWSGSSLQKEQEPEQEQERASAGGQRQPVKAAVQELRRLFWSLKGVTQQRLWAALVALIIAGHSGCMIYKASKMNPDAPPTKCWKKRPRKLAHSSRDIMCQILCARMPMCPGTAVMGLLLNAGRAQLARICTANYTNLPVKHACKQAFLQACVHVEQGICEIPPTYGMHLCQTSALTYLEAGSYCLFALLMEVGIVGCSMYLLGQQKSAETMKVSSCVMPWVVHCVSRNRVHRGQRAAFPKLNVSYLITGASLACA